MAPDSKETYPGELRFFTVTWSRTQSYRISAPDWDAAQVKARDCFGQHTTLTRERLTIAERPPRPNK